MGRSFAFVVVSSLAFLGLTGSSDADAETPGCFRTPATIVGTPGDDLLIGTAGNDVIVGRGGADEIHDRVSRVRPDLRRRWARRGLRRPRRR